jgi:MFS family permease
MTHCIPSVLKILYPEAVKHHNYSKTLTSVTFAGTVVGMLVFGWISDKIGRKFGMVRTTSAISDPRVYLFSDGRYWHRCLFLCPLCGIGRGSP